MRKMATVALAMVLALGLGACNSTAVSNIGNKVNASMTGTVEKDEAGRINVESGQAIKIDPDVKKGEFVVLIKNHGNVVFNEDVSEYDHPIYLTDVLGTCTVSLYSSDTDGKVKVTVCDESEAGESSGNQHYADYDSTEDLDFYQHQQEVARESQPIGPDYEKGMVVDGYFANNTVGFVYTPLTPVTFASPEDLTFGDSDESSLEFVATDEKKNKAWALVMPKDAMPDVMADDFLDFIKDEYGDEIDGNEITSFDAKKTTIHIDASDKPTECVAVNVTYDYGGYTWYRSQLIIPHGDYLIHFVRLSTNPDFSKGEPAGLGTVELP